MGGFFFTPIWKDASENLALQLEATELGAAHGQVRPDHAWKIRLQRLMNSTPLAATALDPAERTHVEKSGFPTRSCSCR